MANVIVQRVEDHGGDQITVHGTVDGVETTATGWHSAMKNHYADDTRDANGHRTTKSPPAPMSLAEQMAYWQGLLAAAAPPPTPAVIYQGA